MMTLKRCAISLTRAAAAALLAEGVSRVSSAQVVAPGDIKDPGLGALQGKHQVELTAAAAETAAPTSPAAPVPSPNKEVLDQQQTGLQPVLDRMVQELGSQAHFDPLVTPELIAFRGASCLRIPVATTLTGAVGGSQYRLATLAFDRHVSHLVRSVLPHFKGAPGFEGIAFRATVTAGASSDSVEFLFPLAALRRYESYDIVGQQLINAEFVLINGERVGLDLQSAETVKP